MLDATFGEIAEYGISGASMGRIAKRAGTGKAALYRRWPNARALCLDALVGSLEQALPSAEVDTGSLRDDIVGSMTAITSQFGGNLGIVVRALIGEAARDTSVANEIIERFDLRLQVIAIANVQRAIQRGEIAPQTIDPYVMAIPTALLIHQLLFTGTVPTPAQFAHIVDTVLMPLITRSGDG